MRYILGFLGIFGGVNVGKLSIRNIKFFLLGKIFNFIFEFTNKQVLLPKVILQQNKIGCFLHGKSAIGFDLFEIALEFSIIFFEFVVLLFHLR